jgi:hypothetical protein
MWQRFVRWFSPETRFQRAWHIGVTAIGLIVVIVLLGDGLLGLFTHISQTNAQNAKAGLDAALTDATTRMNVPETMLQPIRAQEQREATATDGSLSAYQHASDTYAKLTAQVKTIVNMPPSQARALTQKDLDQFAAGVDTLVKGDYIEAPGYQKRLEQAQASFQSAKTTSDYFRVDNFVQDQVAATAAFKPTLDQITQLNALVTAQQKLLNQVSGTTAPSQLLCADGVGSSPADYWTVYYGLMSNPVKQPGSQSLEAQWLDQDMTLFRAAASAKDYETLNTLLTGQITQAQASNAALVPSVAASYLAGFQADIKTLKDYESGKADIKKAFSRMASLSSFPSLGISGWSTSPPAMKTLTNDIATFEKHYNEDAQLLANQSYGNYSRAVKQIQQHRDAMKFDLIYAKTYLDIKTLVDLIAQGQAHTTLNSQKSGDNKKYPDAYEYAYRGTGIGDVINPIPTKIFGTGRLFEASTEQDFEYVDIELQMFIHNISAMLTNLSDKTPYNKVHQTDTNLMQYYGIMSGKVMVVSLREQAARFYVDGKLIKATYLTTGAPDLPSAPGINCTTGAQTNQLMVSPDPPGSPDYYEPTPVKFGIYYHNYGLEIHDAWWRNEFGPLTNLPHYDPAAFNGGSHGCINIPKETMPWVFNFVNYGHIPVLVY